MLDKGASEIISNAYFIFLIILASTISLSRVYLDIKKKNKAKIFYEKIKSNEKKIKTARKLEKIKSRNILSSIAHSVDFYRESLRSFLIANLAFLYVGIGIFLSIVFGLNAGFFISERASDLGYRELSYGVGILVAASLSFLATESGRHNKKHEIKEKNLASLKESASEYSRYVIELKREIARDNDRSNPYKNFSNNGIGIHQSNKKEKRQKIEELIEKCISQWYVFEMNYMALKKCEVKEEELNKQKRNLDEVSQKFLNGTDVGWAIAKEKINKGLDPSAFMKEISKKISIDYKNMERDMMYLGKVLAAVCFSISVFGMYAGFIGGKSGIITNHESIFIDIISPNLSAIGL